MIARRAWRGFRRRVRAGLAARAHGRDLRRWREDAAVRVDELARDSRRSREGPLILIGRHEHMGDVVMATAVIRHVRRMHPDATLVFATQRRYRPLIAFDPHLDDIIDCECVGSLLDLARHRAFDRSHLLVPPGTNCAFCSVSFRDSDAFHPELYEDGRPWFTKGRHLLDLMCEQNGLTVADLTPEVTVPKTLAMAMRRRLEKLVPSGAACRIALHMRTPHWPAKEWPRANFITLINRAVQEFDACIIVLGSEPVADLPAGVIDLTRQTSILETAAVLQGVDLFVGLDSGPSHLASAVGTPSILLFGPTDPATCRPMGRNVTVLWHGCGEDGLFAMEVAPAARANRDIAKITVDDVMDAIYRVLSTCVETREMR